MDTQHTINHVTYEIHRSFIGNHTISERLQEIISTQNSYVQSLTTHTPQQYNKVGGSVPSKEVTT